ncbi:MAG: pyridoxal phosphate-dependent decarboxylase family protein [Candidatus Hodarchaeales archaeon]
MIPEETLDPENWDKMRALGHEMIDDMLEYLKNIRKRPVWQTIPNEVKSYLKTPIPKEGEDREKIYREFKEIILPYPLGNIHPRFWGWVYGTGTPFGILAEILTSAVNSDTGGGEHVLNYVEAQVIDWTKEILGYSSDASGILVSGCSMANFIGLAVARNVKAGYNIIEEGVQQINGKALAFYGSTEIHFSIDKALQLLGLGLNSIRKIPVNDRYEIDVEKLRERIEIDIKTGYKPACIIGSAGTVNTGAVDDLHALADLATEFDTWFHVDGAFGAWCKLSPASRHLVDGLERADSIAFDFHKWMYMQYEVGCVLVRNREDHHFSLSLTPDYLTPNTRGTNSGEYWFSDYGLQLSRGDRALKIWMSIKEHGIAKYGRLIEQNIQQARYLTGLIEKEKDLELLAPTYMNVVNFRYNDGKSGVKVLNGINEEIVLQLQESGVAVPSSTTLHGNYSIRLGITNHRSKKEDFDMLIREVLKIVDNMNDNLV